MLIYYMHIIQSMYYIDELGEEVEIQGGTEKITENQVEDDNS